MTRVSARRRDAVLVTGRRSGDGYLACCVVAMQYCARQVHFNDDTSIRATRPASWRVIARHSGSIKDRTLISRDVLRGKCRTQILGPECGILDVRTSDARHPRRDSCSLTLLSYITALKSAETRGASFDCDALADRRGGGETPQPRRLIRTAGVSWPRSIYHSREESGGGCPKAGCSDEPDRAGTKTGGRTDERLCTRSLSDA